MQTDALLAAIKEAEQHYWKRGNQTLAEVVLDQFFWQTLGKARGWERDPYSSDPETTFTTVLVEPYAQPRTEVITEVWLINWHRFIDHLAEGKDAESFFQQLLTRD